MKRERLKEQAEDERETDTELAFEELGPCAAVGIRDRAGGRGEWSLESQPLADDWLLATLTTCIVTWVW